MGVEGGDLKDYEMKYCRPILFTILKSHEHKLSLIEELKANIFRPL